MPIIPWPHRVALLAEGPESRARFMFRLSPVYLACVLWSPSSRIGPHIPRWKGFGEVVELTRSGLMIGVKLLIAETLALRRASADLGLPAMCAGAASLCERRGLARDDAQRGRRLAGDFPPARRDASGAVDGHGWSAAGSLRLDFVNLSLEWGDVLAVPEDSHSPAPRRDQILHA